METGTVPMTSVKTTDWAATDAMTSRRLLSTAPFDRDVTVGGCDVDCCVRPADIDGQMALAGGDVISDNDYRLVHAINRKLETTVMTLITKNEQLQQQIADKDETIKRTEQRLATIEERRINTADDQHADSVRTSGSALLLDGKEETNSSLVSPRFPSTLDVKCACYSSSVLTYQDQVLRAKRASKLCQCGNITESLRSEVQQLRRQNLQLQQELKAYVKYEEKSSLEIAFLEEEKEYNAKCYQESRAEIGRLKDQIDKIYMELAKYKTINVLLKVKSSEKLDHRLDEINELLHEKRQFVQYIRDGLSTKKIGLRLPLARTEELLALKVQMNQSLQELEFATSTIVSQESEIEQLRRTVFDLQTNVDAWQQWYQRYCGQSTGVGNAAAASDASSSATYVAAVTPAPEQAAE